MMRVTTFSPLPPFKRVPKTIRFAASLAESVPYKAIDPEQLSAEVSRLKKSENGLRLSEKTWQRRAKFNLTLDCRYMAPYLPTLKAIVDNPTEVKRYYGMVFKILEKSLYGKSDKPLPKPKEWRKEFPDYLKQTTELDHSSRYLYAASIVEGLLNRPDLLDTVLSRPFPLVLLVADFNSADMDKGKTTLGEYRDGTNFMFVSPFGLWESTRVKLDNIVLHEFTHALCDDFVEGSKKDMIIGLRPEEQAELRTLKEKFIKKHVPKNKLMAELVYLGIKYRQILAITFGFGQPLGITQQAMRRIVNEPSEFIPHTLTEFILHPNNLTQDQVGKDLYAFYKKIFKIDPLNYGKQTFA